MNKAVFLLVLSVFLVSACAQQNPEDLVGQGTPVSQQVPAGDKDVDEMVVVPETAPKSEPGVKEFKITAKQFSFEPETIEVNKGDKVVIIFKNSQGFHDLVIDEYKVATKQIRTGEQETISFIADKAGTFEYYCSVGTHRAMGMLGTLIVE